MSEDTRDLPENFEALVEENPAAAYTQGLAHQIRQRKGQPMQKKPNVFTRVADALGMYPGPVDRFRTGRMGDVDVKEAPVAGAEEERAVKLVRAQHLNTSTMSQEQLRLRRMNLIEGSKFGRPFHENLLLFLLKFWLVLGPPAFVLLTTSEVAYILTRLAPAGDGSTWIIWGGALFIDLAMMFTTFGVAIKRRDLSEKREATGAVSKRDEAEVWIGTLMWLVFAVINIIGQSAFLLHIIGASGSRDLTILYVFVISRVTGFILGDATTAFFLAKVDNSALKLIARAEREKAALYADIAKAEGERKLVEAKADAEILLVQLKVQQEQEDANFLAELKREMFKDILARRQGLSGAASPELDGPNRSRMRRLDTSS